jgi:hypothetical protein
MIGSMLVASLVFLGQTGAQTPTTGDKQKTEPAAPADALSQKALSEYNALRVKTPTTADARWKLALWCESHGLNDLAYVHFGEVISIDPKRDAAWKKLGFKRYGNRWATDKQIAELEDQKKGDKVWGPRLAKIHKDIHGTNGKAKTKLAQTELDKITDPRAVPSIYREFSRGGNSDQLILLDLLGQIDKPISSKVLALIAVYGKTPDVRRQAIRILRQRPSQDFVEVLVGLMSDEFKYEVRPVRGPGQPGVLFVEGEKFSVNRFYAPPAPPDTSPQFGDLITYDRSGNPVIIRPLSPTSSLVGPVVPVGNPKAASAGVQGVTTEFVQLSPVDAQIEARKGALAAQDQLEADVSLIKSINKDRKAFNDVVISVAKDTTGKDEGKSPEEWRKSLPGGKGFSQTVRPTYGEMAALNYNPVFAPLVFVVGVFIDH